MQLESIYINRETWNNNRVSGQIKFVGNTGTVTLTLTEQNCRAILTVMSDRLIEQSKEAAYALTSAIETAALPAPEGV